MGDQYGFESREKFHRNFMYPNDELALCGTESKRIFEFGIVSKHTSGLPRKLKVVMGPLFNPARPTS